MLKKKRTAKIIGKRFSAIRTRLRAFRKTQEPEELHKLRVEIKKLRAILLLQSDALDSGHLPGEFKPVKTLFKDAAGVRTPHVNLQLLDNYKIPGDTFRRSQETALRKQSIKFRDNVDDYLDSLKPVKKKFLRKLKDIDDKYVQNMSATQLDQLSTLFSTRDPEQLHECRKKLKNLLYIHASLGKPLAAKLKFGKLYLTKLQELIGTWHDILDAQLLLKKARSADKKLLSKLRAEQVRLEKQVFSLAKNFRVKASKH